MTNQPPTPPQSPDPAAVADSFTLPNALFGLLNSATPSPSPKRRLAPLETPAGTKRELALLYADSIIGGSTARGLHVASMPLIR